MLNLRAPARPLTWLLALVGTGMFLLLLAASWLMRDQIYQTFLDPGVPFQTYEPPPAPDYAQGESWAVRPMLAAMDEDEPAVFFVHPTLHTGGDHWNASLDRRSHRERLERFYLPNYAGPFAETGAVFAPRYRHAALYAYMNNREDSLQARLLAYEDVRAAFTQFLADAGDERPIILAGAGQGAGHVTGLLLDIVSRDEDLVARLVAAYIIEAPVAADLFDGPLQNIPLCGAPDAFRCVVTYSAVRADEAARIDAITERSSLWVDRGRLGQTPGLELACVNPLLWNTSEDYAPARLHRGGAAAEGLELGERPSPLASQTGAQCQNGLLFVDQPRSRTLQRPSRLAEARRVPPFNLFYADLEADVTRRAALLAETLAEERRWAPELPEAEEIGSVPVRPID
ncbi:hypothetical protein X907_1638 [Glycocaulis alkaliphilus]|uniref:Uncharacterized protein n=2 Tax=Glycocaulis alkaliphilus TaxID=1434191 RepID=A0A3T0EA64_9PROT|nr:hypothetical protein X907_1638 [Glycocaulis alkaliphilus]GGB76383.1 hypothetical protein GCM10007417_15250 [Glycocaulis alkaliphilus]